MNSATLRGLLIALCAIGALVVFGTPAQTLAAPYVASPKGAEPAEEVADFWTRERLMRARPLPAPQGEPSRSGPARIANDRRGSPGYVPRMAPGTPPRFRVHKGLASTAAASQRSPRGTSFVTEITDTTVFPYRLYGQAFFETPEGLFTCSGTVVVARSKSFVLTAGHCLRERGVWASNWVFVPGYRDGQTPFGVWGEKNLYISTQWGRSENSNFDFGAAVMRKSGGVKIQRAVGGEGIAWQQGLNQIFEVYGYPFGGVYDGESLWLCQSPYAGGDPFYVPPGPSPTAVNCDFPPGSSGGGWIIETAFLNSVTSFGYDELPGSLYGPYFCNAFRRFYKAVHKFRR